MPPRPPTGTIKPRVFNWQACEQDLDAFEQLLSTRDSLSEQDDILPFFRKHLDLALLVASLHTRAVVWDRVGLEIGIAGTYRADLVAGDWHRRAYCFVEFEDAVPRSIFKQNGDWSTRYSHGFHQIIDWLCLLNDLDKSTLVSAQFGRSPIDILGVLVIGRDRHLSNEQRQRLEWRQKYVLVNSHPIYCYTFEGLLRDLRGRVTIYRAAAATPSP